jgi:hypothetical protein
MKDTPDRKLARLLDTLAADLLTAPDDEIAAVLAERGIKLGLKGSAALLDLVDPRIPNLRATDHDETTDDDPPPTRPPTLPHRQ